VNREQDKSYCEGIIKKRIRMVLIRCERKDRRDQRRRKKENQDIRSLVIMRSAEGN
jgi:hypothetical protein